ncbi:MAG: S53 family peptidase [Amnibacterium sp.]
MTRRLLTLSTTVLAAAALTVTSVSAANADSSKTFPGSKPTWAKAANDAGSAPAAQTYEGEIGFDLKDLAGAEAFAKAVSTPGSHAYGHTLSPDAWIDRFAPAKSDFYPVLDYLKKNGLIITDVPKSRLFITFRGTADQLNSLFKAYLHLYHYQGHKLAAPAKAPTLPGTVAKAVGAVVLDQGRTLTRPGAVSASTASTATSTPAQLTVPCSTYWGQHTAKLPKAFGTTTFKTDICGYTAPQFRAAYGVPSSLTGAGQKLAILDAYASPSIVQDVNTYAEKHHVAPLSRATYSQIVPPSFYDQALCGGFSGWQPEQTLDVIAAHGMAPKAHILYVGGFNCGTGLDAAMSTVLDNRLATIVTNSYGYAGEYPQDVVQVNENQHLQAIAEGIGLYFSSGDSGDESDNLGTVTPDYPASSPYVTSVGGTTTGITKHGSVALETGWGTHRDLVVKNSDGSLGYDSPVPGPFWAGAGGGVSAVFSQPWYQAGIVHTNGMRGEPDIAADADPYTGELIGIRPVDEATLKVGPYEEQTYGGTSLASPLFAGEVALVQQAIHHTIGFANPLLYDAYRAHASVFRDVLPQSVELAATSPSTGNSYLVSGDLDTSLTVTRGWDDVTGLGVLTFGHLRDEAEHH